MLQELLNTSVARLTEFVDWNGYIPSCANREKWAELPVSVRSHLVERGLAAAEEAWPALTTTLYMEFSRTGNRSLFEDPYFRRRILLVRMVQAYCAGANDAVMLDSIINAVGSICEESSWVVPAHNWPHSFNLPPVAPDTVDLFCANTSSLLAMTVHLLREDLERETPRLVEKVKTECSRRALAPYMNNHRHWWMGFHTVSGFGPLNNWNPWITANILHTQFLLGSTGFGAHAVLRRAVSILSNYLDVLTEDGGCNEGPSYWGHATGSLFDCLDIIGFATGQSDKFFTDTWFSRAASYIGRMHINDEYFVNFADCTGRLESLPFSLVGRIGAAVGNPSLQEISRQLHERNPEPLSNGDAPEEAFSPFRQLRDLFFSASASIGDSPAPAEADVFPNMEVAVARRRNSGVTFACKGGHNDESHNHNDVGQFILYGDGYPLIIDPGVGEYVRETFNHMRYTIWTMQSDWHNVPRINGLDQKEGREFHSDDFEADDSYYRIGMSRAYPKDAGLENWTREFNLDQGGHHLKLSDRFRFEKDSNQVVWNFILAGEPIGPAAGEGRLRLPSPEGELLFTWPADQLEPTVDFQEIPPSDLKMRTWGLERIYRVRLAARRSLSREGQMEFLFDYKRKGI